MKKLKKGQTFKNWKEICEWFDWKNICGTYKQARLKELSSLCEFHKEGNKIVIDKVYKTPKPIEDGRVGNYTINTDQYKININDNKHIGVYIIIDKDNNCYIGSTAKGFRHRFTQHWNNKEGTMNNTFYLLHDNKADFRILYDMTGVDDIDLIRMVENEFIQYFKSISNYNELNRAKFAYYKGCSFVKKKETTIY